MSIIEDRNFTTYRDEMLNRGGYTQISQELRDKYWEMAIPPKVFDMKRAMSHPFLFSYHVLGIKPFMYQFKIMEDFLNHPQNIVITSRQIGKSTVFAIIALWAVLQNAYPSGPYKDTKVLIVSHTDEGAKKLLGEIYKMLEKADERVSQFTKNMSTHQKNYFRQRIKRQTIYMLEMTKGSVKVYPPTDAVRGNTADILLIDEAAKLQVQKNDPDYFFQEVASPTQNFVPDPRTILVSTPGGLSGFFYDIANPYGDTAIYPWNRIWFPWCVVEDENILENLWTKRQTMMKTGHEKSWKREYEASFTSGLNSWIQPEILDKCIHEHVQPLSRCDEPCTAGLDFGDTNSRTVVTITRPVDYGGEMKYQLIYHKVFPEGYNNANLVDFFKRLSNSFNIKKIVADDCVGGKVPIHLLRNANFNIEGFQFTKQKEEGYELMRNAIMNQRVELYHDTEVIAQLKGINEVELPSGRSAIRKPPGGNDDIADSLMMAFYPYVRMKKESRARVAYV